MSRYTIFTTLLILSVILVNQVSAKVYQCRDGGKTTFRDTPCNANEDMKLLTKFSNDVPGDCYQLTERNGNSYQIKDFWTSKQQDQGLFYFMEQGQRTSISSASIRTLEFKEKRQNCAKGELVRKNGRRTSASVCNVINAVLEHGIKKLAPTDVASITACGNSNPAMLANGYWIHGGKKYTIYAAHISYSKALKRLKVLLFPFPLSAFEQQQISELKGLQEVLKKKIISLADDYRLFGMKFKFTKAEGRVTEKDVGNYWSLFYDGKVNRSRGYDPKRQDVLDMERFTISELREGGLVNIRFALNESEQQADVAINGKISQ